MISHNYKCIFIHIPKCAGTSIEKALGHFDDYSGWGRQDHRSIRRIEPLNVNAFSSSENITELLKRMILKFFNENNIRNKYTVNKNQYNSYFKFTVIRNPWDRAYSWYRNVISDEWWRKRYKISPDMEFYDFLKIFLNKDGLRPQLFWIKDFKGNIPLDYIIRFESLHQDFREVCKLLKLNNTELPHELNSNIQKKYTEFYDDKTRNIIYDAFYQEIEMFEYTFFH